MKKNIKSGKLWRPLARVLTVMVLLAMGLTVAAQPEPGTRTVKFDANGGVFAEGKTPGEYSADSKLFTVKSVGVGESGLITAYAPAIKTTPAGKVFKCWNTSADGTGTKVEDATKLKAGADEFTIYALWRDPFDIEITRQPENGDQSFGRSKMLVIAVTVLDDEGGKYTPTFQWYSNTTASNKGGTPIAGATSATYPVLPGKAVGTVSYYCEVSAKKESTVKTVSSDVATETVVKLTDLTAEDFKVTLPASLIYKSGEAKEVTAALKISDLGAVTVKYKKLPDGAFSSTPPTDAGNYEIRADVAASGNNEAVLGVNLGKMTIGKAPQAQPVGVAGENATDAANDGKITGVSNAMEYRLATEATYTAITGTEVDGLAPGLYYVRLKGDDNQLPDMDAGITIAQGTTSVYTVTFVDGASKLSEQQVKSGEKAVRPTDPAKTGYIFMKWTTDAAGQTAYDFTSSVSANTVVYAQWDKMVVPHYTVKGKVTDSEATAQAGISVVLYPLGKEVSTEPDGTFEFTDVPAGSYNMIVTDDAGNSVTRLITVTGTTDIDPFLIKGNANSKLVVETGAPEVKVDKLDELA